MYPVRYISIPSPRKQIFQVPRHQRVIEGQYVVRHHELQVSCNSVLNILSDDGDMSRLCELSYDRHLYTCTCMTLFGCVSRKPQEHHMRDACE